MTKASQGDYVVVEEKTKSGVQRNLIKVLSTSGSTFEGLYNKDAHIQTLRKTGSFKTADIFLNLGEDPKMGKVYGVDVVEIYRGKKTHEHFGDIHFMYKADKQVRKDLFDAFDKAYTILKNRGLEFLVDDIVWEIIPANKQKYAGMYVYPKNEKAAEKHPRRIKINPEIQPASTWLYVIMHELGHHLHFAFATGRKLNATWIRMFNTSIKVSNIKKEESQHLLDTLLGQEDSPSNFKGQLGEEDALAFKWILRTIQTNNAISVKELDTLFEADMKDDIKKLWPLRSISHKDLKPVISEYACKNYHETIAESFAFWIIKAENKRLPEQVMKLMAKTVEYAKNNRAKHDD